MLELHQTLHSQYGICLWTILAIIVFVIIAVIAVLHFYKQSKRDYNFEKERESKIASEKEQPNGREV